MRTRDFLNILFVCVSPSLCRMIIIMYYIIMYDSIQLAIHEICILFRLFESVCDEVEMEQRKKKAETEANAQHNGNYIEMENIKLK